MCNLPGPHAAPELQKREIITANPWQTFTPNHCYVKNKMTQLQRAVRGREREGEERGYSLINMSNLIEGDPAAFW